ncbi:cellulose binding domain-containing protein [Kitasatospora sp. NPDC048540]|uniref:cellulose binding domain-containing protein n=1 Tax=unclassified Kitasatospora TaxID=2633591 RepID=UPI0005399C76|nr:cellulose binding domain-containing protein [Kitasatospora sp. MBT63]
MGSARSASRRRVWNVLKLLFLVIVLVAAGNALYPAWRAAHPDPSDLTIRHRTEPTAVVPVAKPWLEVINSSKKAIPLNEVTLRYYFTADGGVPYGFNCVEAAVGCANIDGTIVALANPSDKADHYLELSFTAGAGSLQPGVNSKGIQLQLYRLDHQDLNQADDRSFEPANTSFKPAKLVTAYIAGKLAWGDQPADSTAASGQPAAAANPKPAAPAGIAFDNFHYSGATDPALVKHGWRIRTSKGGPGVADTWSAAGVSFPAEPTAQGGQTLQLRASTDGTKQGTTQAQVDNADTDFLTGTYAARIFFSDQPSSGQPGDHINQSFYTISSNDSLYSELDNEYMPNGGWGSPGPVLDTTSWYSAKNGDRVTRRHNASLQGWHTIVITAVKGVATYSLDGKELFSSNGKYFPRQTMGVNFNTWFVDLPFKGQRSWDMKINWFYYNANQAMSQADVEKTVADYYSSGTNYINTVPKS